MKYLAHNLKLPDRLNHNLRAFTKKRNRPSHPDDLSLDI